MNVDKLITAFKEMRKATFQSHTEHWDTTMQSGRGCPECIRVREMREEADRLFEEAIRGYS